MEPNTPQTMEELVQEAENIPIFTLSVVVGKEDFKLKLRNALTEIIIPAILANEKLSRREIEMYNRFGNVVQIALNSSYHIVADYSTYSVVWYRYTNEIEAIEGRKGVFAVVDSSPHLNPFRQMLALFGKYKPARPPNYMSVYIMRNVWFVQKNFFANIFATGLTSMVESGIHGRWYENGNIQPSLVQYYASYEKTYIKQNKLIGSQFEATSLEQVNVLMQLFLGMLLGSLAIFMYECRCTFKTLVRAAANRVSIITFRLICNGHYKIKVIGGIR